MLDPRKTTALLLFSVMIVAGCQADLPTYDAGYEEIDGPNAADLLPENLAGSEENQAYAGRANTTCVTEANVSFVPSDSTKLTSAQMENVFSGNTMLSADQDGVFAIHFLSDGETVGWMPKKTSLNIPDWDTGTVSFANDQYCRTWTTWNGGVTTCWEIHKGQNRIDLPSYYFVCGNGGVAGDQHVVLEGNAMGVQFSGKNYKNGSLTQDENSTSLLVQKYFGNYKNK